MPNKWIVEVHITRHAKHGVYDNMQYSLGVIVVFQLPLYVQSFANISCTPACTPSTSTYTPDD